jgi:hypothetical protein
MPTVQLESDSELSTIHVVPGNGGWSVHAAGEVEPACVHENATEAQSAARRLAAGRGVNVIVLHDRYHRLHVTPVHASGRRARTLAAEQRLVEESDDPALVVGRRGG